MQHHPQPILDEHWQGYELAADDTHRYVWIWHGYNIRLIAVPLDVNEAMGYDHGWCFPRDPDLVKAAVAAWNADTQDEPTGWHKRATHPVRRAPLRDQEPDYNRARCVHGPYIADGCRTVNCPDASAYAEQH